MKLMIIVPGHPEGMVEALLWKPGTREVPLVKISAVDKNTGPGGDGSADLTLDQAEQLANELLEMVADARNAGRGPIT